MRRSTTLCRLTWCLAIMCALVNGCTPAAVTGGPVCAITAVERIGNGVNRVAAGWPTGPITSGAFRPMMPVTFQESLVENATDIDELWTSELPGRVFRFSAGPSATYPGAQVQTAAANWTSYSTPFIVGATFTRVSLTHLFDRLQACYLESRGNAQHITLAFPSSTTPGGWATGDIELWGTASGPGVFQPTNPTPGAGQRGPYVDVACAGAEAGVTPGTPPTELHVCAVSSDGHLWHTIFDGQTWQPFGDVEDVISDVGLVLAVDCIVDGRQLHLVAVTASNGAYHLKHTVRSANAWRPWEELLQSSSGAPWPQGSTAPIKDVAIAYCDADGPQPSSGPRETRRLNITWATDDSLSLVVLSKSALNWVSGWPLSQISPSLSVGPSVPAATFVSVAISQRPYYP